MKQLPHAYLALYFPSINKPTLTNRSKRKLFKEQFLLKILILFTMNKKQGDQIQFSPRKKTVEKGKWIQNQSTHYSSRRIVIKNRQSINLTRNFFICLKMFSALLNLLQYILTSQLCVCDETDSNKTKKQKQKKHTHTQTQWYGFSHCLKRLFCNRYLLLQDFSLPYLLHSNLMTMHSKRWYSVLT